MAFAIAAGRAADALARSDARRAADPGDTVALDGREALLRATGRVDEALAAARGRVETLPPGPRRSLEEAGLALQSGDHDGCVDALERFAESAFQPPAELRAAALDVSRRVPAAHERRSRAMRRVARDGILADPDGSFEFYAFDALGAATEPAAPVGGALAAVRTIADEAASHEELRADPARWLGAADFLLSQGAPAAAAEFLRARLDEPQDLDAADVAALARDGRLVVIGLQGGVKGEVDLGALLRKGGTIHATSLRSRSTEQKTAICDEVQRWVWPWVEAGIVTPVVDRVLPLGDAAEAHRVLEAGDVVGKVLLTPDPH